MVAWGDLLGLLAVYGYVTIVMLLYVAIDRRELWKNRRKFVHIMVGNIVFFWWLFDSRWVMGLLAAAPFIVLLYLCSPSCRLDVGKGTVLERVASKGHDNGLTFYAISWTILALVLFNNLQMASIGVVAMSYGDGLGCVVGRTWGRHRITRDGKTLEGSIGVFLGTMTMVIVVLLFYGLLSANGVYVSPTRSIGEILAMGVISGAWVSIVELLTPGAYDNLMIPLSTPLLLILLGF